MDQERIGIYLDDVRTPVETNRFIDKWVVVRTYDEFVDTLTSYVDKFKKLPPVISLDHDLGEKSVSFIGANPFAKIPYEEIDERTGMDCAKFLIETCIEKDIFVSDVVLSIHSHNVVGTENLYSYLMQGFNGCNIRTNNVRLIKYRPEFIIEDHMVEEALKIERAYAEAKQKK